MKNSEQIAIDFLQKSTDTLLEIFAKKNKENLTDFDKKALDSLNKQLNILKGLKFGQRNK